MSWAIDTAGGRDGFFRNTLRTVDDIMSERAAALWQSLPEPKADAALAIARHCGFSSRRQGVMKDLLHLMLAEQAAYRRNIRAEHGAYAEARSPGDAMAIDQRELAAEHLAAMRAEARFTLQPPPQGIGSADEQWMSLDHPER